MIFNNLIRIAKPYCYALYSLFFVSGFATATDSEFPNHITIATQHWPPYQQEVNGIQTGFSIHALRCVMAKMKQRYKVVFVPWGRAQNGVKTGQYDAFFAASQNEWRDEFAVLSNTFIEQKWKFYLHKDSTLSTDIDSLKASAVFGTRIHSNTDHWLHKNEFQKIRQFGSIEQLVKLLSNKRIDAIMENALLFEEEVLKAGYTMSDFKVIENMDYNLGVYFSKRLLKKHPQFLSTFNKNTNACIYAHD